jgi:hypothetical protein
MLDFTRIAVPILGCPVWMVGGADLVIGNGEMGFRGEIRLAN